MTKEEVLKKIYSILDKRGIDKARFYNILTEKRKIKPAYNSRIYKYADSLIKPAYMKMSPAYIENLFNSNSDNLLDLCLYFSNINRNINLDNLDKDADEILNSYINDPKVEFRLDDSNDIFLKENGNHRTLMLILCYYMEIYGARSRSEQEAIDRKYTFQGRVNLLHPTELVDALDHYVEEEKTRKGISKLALEYRDYHSNEPKKILDYDPQKKIYIYDRDGQRVVGDYKRMAAFLNSPYRIPGLLAYKSDTNYYVSYYNQVVTTKNKEIYLSILKNAKSDTNRTDIVPQEILAIFNYDENLYDLIVEYPTDYKIDLHKNPYFIKKYQTLLDTETYFNKCDTDNPGDLEYLLYHASPDEKNAGKLVNRRYSGLTKKELDELTDLLKYEKDLLETIKVNRATR